MTSRHCRATPNLRAAVPGVHFMNIRDSLDILRSGEIYSFYESLLLLGFMVNRGPRRQNISPAVASTDGRYTTRVSQLQIYTISSTIDFF